jgi:hypothetical protein
VTTDELRLAPLPGDGLLARFPSVVFFSPAAGAQAGELLDLCRSVAAAGPRPGRMLARRVAALLGASEEEYPPFCAVGQADEGVAVIVHGAVDVSCTADGTSVTLSGRDSTTWVDRVISGNVTEVHGVPSGASPPGVDALADLGSGVVPAGGFALGPDASAVAAEEPTGAAPAVAPAPVPAEASAAASSRPSAAPAPPQPEPAASRPHIDFESVLLVDAQPEEQRAPLPVGGTAPEPETPAGMVQGIYCSRGHFNDPNNLFCGVCGIGLVQQTHNLVLGPRPPLGFLVFEDASTYSLDSDYVIGRDPSDDPRVRSGAARALAIDDPERTVSRVHAEVVLNGWQVQLVDRGSTNGTFIWDEPAAAWTTLVKDQPNTLKPGVRAAVGRRTFLFESPFEHRVH